MPGQFPVAVRRRTSASSTESVGTRSTASRLRVRRGQGSHDPTTRQADSRRPGVTSWHGSDNVRTTEGSRRARVCWHRRRRPIRAATSSPQHLVVEWYRIPDSKWKVSYVSAAFTEYIQVTHETHETGSIRDRIRVHSRPASRGRRHALYRRPDGGACGVIVTRPAAAPRASSRALAGGQFRQTLQTSPLGYRDWRGRREMPGRRAGVLRFGRARS